MALTMLSRSAANALRSAEIWACRLFSSTIRSGQTRFISASLLMTAPRASISVIRTSNARAELHRPALDKELSAAWQDPETAKFDRRWRFGEIHRAIVDLVNEEANS